MITEDELRIRQVRFESKRQSLKAQYRELEQLRRKFVAKFPPSQIPLLTLDDYIEGKGSTDSFCYWVEWKTAKLGHIQGSNSSKFGVFFGKKSGHYEFTSRFQNEHTAIIFLREQITRLLEAGRINDLGAIRHIEISPMFKGKILFLYYPEKFLNVFSEDHVDHFLREAGFVVPDDDVLAKRELLLAFKNGDRVMSKWKMYEFMRFLYATWPPLPKASKVSEPLRKYVDDESFPAPQNTHGEFISFELGDVSDSGGQREQKQGGGEIDFEKQNRRNKRVGDQGEDVVYWKEKRWLEANSKGDLAQNVEAVCRNDPGAGYDIKSFELDGTPKYIEVKTTTGKPPADKGNVRFHLSAQEYEQAQKLPNYYLFIVFDVKSARPKIWRIREPAKLKPGLLRLQPSAYHATFTAHRQRVE